MAAGEISAAGYILGLTGAVAAFIVNDRITQAMVGVRFRRRIAADIGVIIEGYHGHYHALAQLIEQARRTLDPAEASRLTWYPRPIWQNDYTLLDHVYQHSSHLRPDELLKCVEFYDNLGRLYEIRRAYNEAAKSAAVQPENRELQIKFALERLINLQAEYADVVRCGCAALKLLAQEHWLVSIDQPHFEEIAATYDDTHTPSDIPTLISLLNGQMILLANGAGFNRYWQILPGEVFGFQISETAYDKRQNIHIATVGFSARSAEKEIQVTGELKYYVHSGVANYCGFAASAVKKIGEW